MFSFYREKLPIYVSKKTLENLATEVAEVVVVEDPLEVAMIEDTTETVPVHVLTLQDPEDEAHQLIPQSAGLHFQGHDQIPDQTIKNKIIFTKQTKK